MAPAALEAGAICALVIGTLRTSDIVEILPYHDMGRMKHEKLGIEYKLRGTPHPQKRMRKACETVMRIMVDAQKEPNCHV